MGVFIYDPAVGAVEFYWTDHDSELCSSGGTGGRGKSSLRTSPSNFDLPVLWLKVNLGKTMSVFQSLFLQHL